MLQAQFDSKVRAELKAVLLSLLTRCLLPMSTSSVLLPCPRLHSSVLEKRRSILRYHATTDLYIRYKWLKWAVEETHADAVFGRHISLCGLKGCGSDLQFPDTPRPEAHSSKRQWEAAMYNWRSCMRQAVMTMDSKAADP